MIIITIFIGAKYIYLAFICTHFTVNSYKKIKWNFKNSNNIFNFNVLLI